MFQQNHKTSGGETLLVAQMDDQHLVNMIGAIVSWAERASGELQRIVAQTRAAARAEAQGDMALAEAQRKLYGLPALPKLEDATGEYARAMNGLSARLEPYLLEAWTRTLDDAAEEALVGLRERWQLAVGRDAALPNPQRTLALTAGPLNDDDCPL